MTFWRERASRNITLFLAKQTTLRCTHSCSTCNTAVLPGGRGIPQPDICDSILHPSFAVLPRGDAWAAMDITHLTQAAASGDVPAVRRRAHVCSWPRHLPWWVRCGAGRAAWGCVDGPKQLFDDMLMFASSRVIYHSTGTVPYRTVPYRSVPYRSGTVHTTVPWCVQCGAGSAA
eukprot:353135-Chlamydomonas_euryale.AAC.1